jgi:hypothetical protein
MFDQAAKSVEWSPASGPEIGGPKIGDRPPTKVPPPEAVAAAEKAGVDPAKVQEARKEIFAEYAHEPAEPPKVESAPAKKDEKKDDGEGGEGGFGKMKQGEDGSRAVQAQDGKSTAEVKGKDVTLHFDKDVPAEERQKVAQDALKSLGAEAQDETKLAEKVAASPGTGQEGAKTDKVKVERKMTEATPEVARKLAKQMWSLDKVLNPNKDADPNDEDASKYEYYGCELNATELALREVHEGMKGAFNGRCQTDPETWQSRFAKQGAYVPIMYGKGHRWLVAQGELIIDPTFGQMVDGKPDAKAAEPFVGTYQEMIARVSGLMQKGLFEGTDPATELEKHWGILPPGKDGKIRVTRGTEQFGEKYDGGGAVKAPEGEKITLPKQAGADEAA